MKENYQNVIIGGGLAGLVSAYLLAKNGQEVLLIEKKNYPFHRVCGEYVSKEALGFLNREGLYPTHLDLPEVMKFLFSDTSGDSVTIPLDLGGFGVSRYELDYFLYQKAINVGVQFLLGTQVYHLNFEEREDLFELELSDNSHLKARNVIGAFGKRSRLDKDMNRPFISQRSPYIGVKYHVKMDYPQDTVALHNFEGGYCGINAIEHDKFNICYLGSREQLRELGSIEAMEKEFLWKNPQLKKVFTEAEFLFEKPEVINEINFEPKAPVENHVLMAGDAAGLITPLCGNGMAIAIHSAKMAAEALIQGASRKAIEHQYASSWKRNFQKRLWVGRKVQLLFGTHNSSVFAGKLIKSFPLLANQIVKSTHGKPF
ncbi:NAD(P)/FAD-dependent oxidoreductase [Algoriphagus pacificus]|uniref:NAD(P)/FAD-dependent oxidoreductase n=1 Tax=Algoriphagus pacificus TaxID=2811234 RepID=A0ABS3CAM2_9BACT|nr:NAD(P)/FAD-dependent oxidoreductase [Algoriphagus pacificus]MBN7814161.1 NAD(P)/FAD-dependent oxidoreductase [Algoriphagus pacificus]